MRINILILKIANSALFGLVIYLFLNIFDLASVIIDQTTGDLTVVQFIISLYHLLSYVLYLVFFIIGWVISLVIGFLFGFLRLYSAGYMVNFIQIFFEEFLNSWFVFPSGVDPSLSTIPGLILGELDTFLQNIYLLFFQVLFIASMVYLAFSILRSDPKYSLFAIGFLVAMMIIPSMAFGLRDMFALFYPPGVEFTLLGDMFDPREPGILSNLDYFDNAFIFLLSPIALFSIVSYLYLEFAFQINYIEEVTSPSLERGERLESQLRLLRKESLQITANAEKIREEAKQRKKELGIEGSSVRKFLTQQEQKFSYIKEMIEKRKLEEEEKKLISAASKTRRLGRYVERLFEEDPEAEDTITAKSSAPRPKNLITSTILTSSYRLILLFIISFIIIHPQWLLEPVFQLPPAITEAVANYSPEIIIILLIPVMLLFPVISQIISYVKHRNLMIRLQQEGRIKEILTTVEDYVKEAEEEEELPEAEGVTVEEATTEAT
ncbi:MAG: conserved membrane protein of unknown function [Promethearchaeota archaeon]|nr:MAG: conserved membrane protein of unknown function [Candidatus Lokiarchaeota archaeon]